MTERTVEYLVYAGSAGIAGPQIFDNEARARECAQAERRIDSYMGPGHRRQVQLVKRTTETEELEIDTPITGPVTASIGEADYAVDPAYRPAPEVKEWDKHPVCDRCLAQVGSVAWRNCTRCWK